MPLLSALVMLGYGVAGAVSPYLGVVLRDNDARLPFIISSAVLLLSRWRCPGSSATRARRRPAANAAAAKPLGGCR